MPSRNPLTEELLTDQTGYAAPPVDDTKPSAVSHCVPLPLRVVTEGESLPDDYLSIADAVTRYAPPPLVSVIAVRYLLEVLGDLNRHLQHSLYPNDSFPDRHARSFLAAVESAKSGGHPSFTLPKRFGKSVLRDGVDDLATERPSLPGDYYATGWAAQYQAAGPELDREATTSPCTMHDGVCAISCVGRADLPPQPMFHLPEVDITWPTLLAGATHDDSDVPRRHYHPLPLMPVERVLRLSIVTPVCFIHELSNSFTPDGSNDPDDPSADQRD
jgi:hypothetical protein